MSKTQFKGKHISPKEEVKAYVFGFFLLSLSIILISVAFLSSGPIILGSEMNTNGLVEYLCLGNGCEDLNRVSW